MGKESVTPVLTAGLLPGSPAWPGTHWKLKATRKERKLERAQIFQKDFGEERPGPLKKRQKQGLFKYGMSSGGSDTIPGHATVQGTQLRSYRRLGQLSRIEKRRISIFCRPLGHLHLRHPRERG